LIIPPGKKRKTTNGPKGLLGNKNLVKRMKFAVDPSSILG